MHECHQVDFSRRPERPMLCCVMWVFFFFFLGMCVENVATILSVYLEGNVIVNGCF